jgi:hypothetical protein
MDEGGVAVVFIFVIDIGPGRDRELGWCGGGRRWRRQDLPINIENQPPSQHKIEPTLI